MRPPDEIHVRWERGRMAVRLDAFFPASAADVRKLLKIVRMDLRGGDEAIKNILEFLEWRRAEDEKALKALTVEFQALRQAYAELRERARSKRAPDGVRLTKEELEETRRARDLNKKAAAAAEREFKRRQVRLTRTTANVKLIRKEWKANEAD